MAFATIKECLSDPKRWTKRCYARNKNGAIDHSSKFEDAASWCLRGACVVVYGSVYPPEAQKIIDALPPAIPRMTDGPFGVGYGDPLVLFNDDPNTTHEMLLEVLERAGV